MTEMISALSEISGRYRAVFCDLWGCLHNGKTPFPAAVAALQAYRAQGGIVVLMTNAPRPKGSVAAQLERIGAPRDCYDLIVSSGDAAQYALVSGAVGHRVYFIGSDKDMPFFTDLPPEMRDHPPISFVPLAEAEGIVCTGLRDDLTETPEDYRAELLEGKTRGLTMLCANPDIVVDMGDKRVYCAGALAEDYVRRGGEVLYFGKPHPPIYDLARRILGTQYERISNEEILCIGDGPWTDILGGQNEGLDTLFITGGIAAPHFGPDPTRPDPALMQTWLAQERLAPTWVMPHLA
ncbi:HAD family hydrolase [Gemmobacter serpentinus]|uniref:HAD family hydrolase n=1 Tax=Gemmobacter serpentinus TaxID=2652247 RepID=UPI00124E32CF|nr:HAD family hydrolase [Gemmobacter serpentinus]